MCFFLKTGRTSCGTIFERPELTLLRIIIIIFSAKLKKDNRVQTKRMLLLLLFLVNVLLLLLLFINFDEIIIFISSIWNTIRWVRIVWKK